MIGQTISHYRIVDNLGEGAMGVVYKAQDIALGRHVALKFLGPHLLQDDQARQRFVREARAAASLNHPNICTVYELGEAERSIFIAMEFVEGQPLDSKMREGELKVEEAIELCIQIADGLQEAHQKGIIHRDIKPQNLMFTSRRAIKIMDFGLALLARDAARTRGGIGTPLYMSPEQVQGEPVDHRTDIWSLGAVLYEMLTGRPPFSEEHEAALFYTIVNEQPEPLEALRPGLSPQVIQTVARALHKQREERYASAAEIRADLDHASRGRFRPTADPAQRQPSSALSAQDERVHASILVSNLGGYSELVEDVSPDRLDQIVARIRSLVIEVIAKHQGILNRFSGEELMAVFGVSAGSEDYAARAARAALELHAAIREFGSESEAETNLGLWLSSGIDSGLIHTRSGAMETAWQLTGRAQRVASSLALHASREEILISGDCRRLLGTAFETVSGSSVTLPGAKGAMTPFALKAESESTAIVLGDTLSPFAGREAELLLLNSCLEKALSGHGQLVTILGDAGVGKTRLLHEFRDLVPSSCTTIQCRCQPHEMAPPFQPFVQLLRGLFRGVADSGAPLTQEHVKSKALELDSELSLYLPIYFHLLALEGDEYSLPDTFGQSDLRLTVLEALASIVTVSTQRAPLVLVFEDWHWSDNSSREGLEQLVELIENYPIFIAVTSRPEYTFNSLTYTHHTPILLRPLEPANSVHIARATLNAESVSAELEQILLARTGGNPFYIEELCRSMKEEGSVSLHDGEARLARPLDQLGLPATVQGAIRSRLQRLDSSARDALRIASVIGGEFSQALLSEVWGERAGLATSLSALREAALVRRIRVGPNAAYRFSHAMIHQVVYGSLLRRQKKGLHRSVGEAIEARCSARPEEHASRLAQHFREANVWEKAYEYGRLAANRNWVLSQYPEALRELELVEESFRELPDPRQSEDALVNVLLEQERLCETMAKRDRQQSIIDRLLSVLEPKGRSLNLAQAYVRHGDLLALRNDFASCQEALDKALTTSRACGSEDLELRCLRSFVFAYSKQREFDKALPIAENLVSRDRERADAPALVKDLSSLCSILRALGDHQRAMTVVNEAVAMHDQQPHVQLRASLFFLRGELHREMGDTEAALKDIKIALEHSPINKGTVLGVVGKPGPLLITMSSIHLERGEIEESLEWCQKAVDWGRRSRLAEDQAFAHRQSGLVLFSAGREEEALPHLEEAAAILARMESAEEEADVQRALATVREKTADLSGATKSWERFLTLDDGPQDPNGRLEAFESLGRIARKVGEDPGCVLAHYMSALELAIECNDLKKQAHLHNTIGIVHWGSGAYSPALESYRHALSICYKLNDRPHTALMLNSIGVTLHKLGRHADALSTLDDALRLERELGNKALEGHALAAAGDVHLDLKQCEEAKRCYEESLQIRKALRDRTGEAWMLHHLAKANLAAGRRTVARALADQAVAIARERGIEDLADACGQFRD